MTVFSSAMPSSTSSFSIADCYKSNFLNIIYRFNFLIILWLFILLFSFFPCFWQKKFFFLSFTRKFASLHPFSFPFENIFFCVCVPIADSAILYCEMQFVIMFYVFFFYFFESYFLGWLFHSIIFYLTCAKAIRSNSFYFSFFLSFSVFQFFYPQNRSCIIDFTLCISLAIHFAHLLHYYYYLFFFIHNIFFSLPPFFLWGKYLFQWAWINFVKCYNNCDSIKKKITLLFYFNNRQIN